MDVLVFLHGTTIMHRAGLGRTRAERVRQSRERDPSVRDYAAYVPIGRAAEKLRAWQAQGAAIAYLSSHTAPEDVAHDRAVLARYGFPAGEVHYRRPGETYQRVAERVAPDVLVEDDCESLGGPAQMVSPGLAPAPRATIRGLTVEEFAGIDGLPDALGDLRR